MKIITAPFGLLSKTLKNFARHDGMVMAGHMAFLGLLALFPFIIFLVSLAGFFGQSDAGPRALGYLFEHMPEDVVRVLQGPIEKMIKTTGRSILTFSILGAIWVSSSAIDAARLAVIRAYEAVSHRSYLRRRAEGLLLVVLSASSIIIGMTILVFGPVAWKIIIAVLPLEADWKLVWNLLRLSVSISLIFGALCLSYFILAPRNLARKENSRTPVMAGAVTSLILWMTIGNIFSLYLKHFGNYDVTYGSLAGAIITLMLFYFLSASYILGAELNAALYSRRKKMIKNSSTD